MAEWWEDLASGLTGTAINTATHIPVVGGTISSMIGKESEGGTSIAPVAEVKVERSGIPYVLEIVGVKGAPPEDKKAILFGSKTTSVAMGYAVIAALIIMILAGVYYLMMEPKKKPRARRRIARK